MNTTLLRSWADALDSGDYTPVTGQYFGRSLRCACAVGVCLIELHNRQQFPLAQRDMGDYQRWVMTDATLGNQLVNALESLGVPAWLFSSAIDWNDNQGMGFSQIAYELRRIADAYDEKAALELPR